MSEINKKRVGPGWVTAFVLLGLIDLALLMRWILKGTNVTLFNPQGLISHEQHSLFVLIAILLCAVAIPVVLMLYFIAWKFRESNTKAKHTTAHASLPIAFIWFLLRNSLTNTMLKRTVPGWTAWLEAGLPAQRGSRANPHHRAADCMRRRASSRSGASSA